MTEWIGRRWRWLAAAAALALAHPVFAAPAPSGDPLAAAQENTLPLDIPPPVGAGHGMVATAQHLASQVGADVLARGGNAVDAAVAVAYALAVVYPAAGNLGGGGFMTVRMADGRTDFLDFREKAPLAATRTMYQDANGQVIPGKSVDGWLAVAVPGTVAGMEVARTKFGTLSRQVLMAPAIRLAAKGYVLGEGDVSLIAAVADNLKTDHDAAAIFLDDGEVPETGTNLVQADLARTLEAISKDGPAAFYHGPVGAELVAASRRGGGIITQGDLDHYKVRELPPLSCSYRGYHIDTAPPPSAGGIAVCEILSILQGYDMHALGFHSAASVHLMVEAMRRTYADRVALGDPDFVHDPIDRILSPEHIAAARAAIPADRAMKSSEIKVDLGGGGEGHNTTHFSIIDGHGNAVAMTYTLNNWFGAGVVAGSTGIVMNDEMDDFTARPGTPNMFGLVQGEANAIAPGKTPVSSMSPTILSKDGHVVMSIGSPGGSRIPTITLEVIMNVIDYGMDIRTAIDEPRIHQQWMPEPVEIEPGALTPAVQKQLEAMGYTFKPHAPWGVGAGVLVGAKHLGGRPTPKVALWGSADDRRPGGAAVGE
ncbi:gamma-glutamyltranspeptidase/glutathione hydrolase [Endobacter medicaginis]|uniref:Glutathione hydrolase proenzyme n=1 Tax=Endobacter medicaginis TaxID=1181271 RepID=A0A839USI5_9PROT|nr:gamma-glutamyltransferase [Endobacter medicaginis]MBB3173218.1 gamma-glutamyltranspeptidase/glutathione hydrolase [Endobacter medicaginis]MCX5476493.1 gamma-glutamyltransferase [Endobacter medicaginis]